jgi:predicted transcriptional regulator
MVAAMQPTLSEWIVNQGMTRSAFADMCNVDPATITRVCRGQRPNLQTALAIEAGTGGAVSAATLLATTAPRRASA